MADRFRVSYGKSWGLYTCQIYDKYTKHWGNGTGNTAEEAYDSAMNEIVYKNKTCTQKH